MSDIIYFCYYLPETIKRIFITDIHPRAHVLCLFCHVVFYVPLKYFLGGSSTFWISISLCPRGPALLLYCHFALRILTSHMQTKTTKGHIHISMHNVKPCVLNWDRTVKINILHILEVNKCVPCQNLQRFYHSFCKHSQQSKYEQIKRGLWYSNYHFINSVAINSLVKEYENQFHGAEILNMHWWVTVGNWKCTSYWYFKLQAAVRWGRLGGWHMLLPQKGWWRSKHGKECCQGNMSPSHIYKRE